MPFAIFENMGILAIGPAIVFLTQVAIQVAVAYAAYWVASQFASPSKQQMPKASTFPVQTSMKAIPVQKTFGTDRVSGNVIWIGPLTPYTVRHSMGGKGGAPESHAYETRYRRSFLISFGEGPGSILRLWKGKKEVPLMDFTLFEGIDNSGIKALTGEDYGEYKNDICLFADEYDLGNGEAIPNFSAEITSGNLAYFIGCDFSAGSDKSIVYKIGSDSAIDTTWADGGGWHYTTPYGGTIGCYDMIQLPDGRLLVVHNDIWIEGAGLPDGKTITCTMLTAAGAIDTSWGYNGHYITNQTGSSYPMAQAYKILQDNDGKFHLFGRSDAGHLYNYHIFDADGTQLYVYAWTARHSQAIYDATFNADKSRIIIVGGDVLLSGGVSANAVALNPSDGTIDEDWDGNLSRPGYGHYGIGASRDAYAIARVSDGYIIHFQYSGTDLRTLTKITLDGSAVDTSWGSDGYNEAGYGAFFKKGMVAAGDLIYTLGNNLSGGLDQTIQHLMWWDGDGNLLESVSFDAAVSNVYHCLGLVVGHLIVGTKKLAPAVNDVENWTPGLTYLSGFDIPANPTTIEVVQPQAPTRDALDCNPAYIVKEIITNTQWGGRQPANRIHAASFADCEDYWGARGMLLSLTLDESKSWKDWVDYVLSHVGGARFNSGGTIHLGVLRDEDGVFELEDEDLVQADGDPLPPKVQIIPRPYSDTFNRIEVAWQDRDNKYDLSVAVAYDAVDHAKSGTLRKKTIKLLGIKNPDLAQKMAYRFLIDALYRYNIYKFTVLYANQRIENFDVGTLSDNHLLSTEKIRVLSRQEDVHGRNIEITAMDDYAEHYPDITYATAESLHTPDADVVLADATITFREDVNISALYLSVAPGNAQFNGGYVYRSYDNATFELVGRFGVDGVTGGDSNSIGTIQGSLPSHGSMTWAPDESVLVSIGTVTDLASAGSEDEFWHDRKLAKVGDEIIAFKTATETATAGIWQISNLRRGLFGTEPAAHSSGETFATLDANLAYTFNESDVGQALYFKVCVYYGDNAQNIADVSSFSVTIQGYYQRPAATSLLRLAADENDGGSGEYSGASFTLYWNLGSRVSGYNWGGYDVSGGGVPYGNYTADGDLQAIVLKFEEQDETPIGQREIAVGESATITKATDLGGNNPARVLTVPRRALESRLENSLLVDDGS